MSSLSCPVEQPKIYQVGGSVRDLLLGRKAHDIDYAVEISSFAALEKWIESVQGQVLHKKPEFGSIKVRWSGSDFKAAAGKSERSERSSTSKVYDFTTCRTDGKYTDGRHPDMVAIGTIEQDLKRRDFTINALAVPCIFNAKTTTIEPMVTPSNVTTSSHNILDLTGGLQDLKEGKLKCVGLTRDRFYEDSIRLLRAMRFSITMDLKLDSDIVSAFEDAELISRLDLVSRERILDEINKCFACSTLKTIQFLESHVILREYLFTKKKVLLKCC